MSKYHVNYFIKFFQNMPEEHFSMTDEPQATDAWEWLNEEEADALYEIIRPYGMLIHVNDGIGEYANLGPTIRLRVLAFLDIIHKSRTCII